VTVLELRNYLLKRGATADFMRYFEEHFLESQRNEGMDPLGQFEVVGQPDRFVWIRAFEDMEARHRGLTGFYGGAFWLGHRDEANAMMLEHHDVHLLRPLAPMATLTAGDAPGARASSPPGRISSETGLITADFYCATPKTRDDLVDRFERRVRAALIADGHQVLGHFVAEDTPNDYPRLPVIQDPALLVVMSAYRDHHECTRMRGGWSARGPAALEPLLTRDVTTLYLRPTLRSLIRYRANGAL
jgi:NIPSNAP